MPRPDPANPFAPPSARLVAGGLFRDPAAWAAAEEALTAAFGPVTGERLVVPFDGSGYYDAEMGRGLTRVFLVFRDVVLQEELAAIKRLTVSIERRLADCAGDAVRRRVNLDPGLLSLSTLVLASTKGFAHRVYLGQGIHAEVTLLFRGNAFAPVPWTYPDYRQPEALAFFTAARNSWLREVRSRGRAAARPVEEVRACC
jgi:hypothetical protein